MESNIVVLESTTGKIDQEHHLKIHFRDKIYPFVATITTMISPNRSFIKEIRQEYLQGRPKLTGIYRKKAHKAIHEYFKMEMP